MTATKPETKKARTERERQEAIAELRELLPKGTTVYTRLDHVSRSGMQRSITPIVIKDNAPLYLTHLVSRVLDWSRSGAYEGIKVDGCGMDMGFHLVYSLSATLYGHQDQGGYALNHRWL